MPCITSLFTIVIKHVTGTLNISAIDYSVANWIGMSAIFQIIGIYSFVHYEGSFDINLFIKGFLASLINLVGGIFTISCYATGSPMGPSSALLNTQVILVTIIASIIEMKMPLTMQMIGLIFGLLGALQLTIPDQLYALLCRCIHCRAPPQQQQQQASIEGKQK